MKVLPQLQTPIAPLSQNVPKRQALACVSAGKSSPGQALQMTPSVLPISRKDFRFHSMITQNFANHADGCFEL